MPVLTSNGKQYRISLLTGSIRVERPPPYTRQPPPYTRSVSADRYQDVSRAYLRRGRAYTTGQTFHAIGRQLTLSERLFPGRFVPQRMINTTPWSIDDDQVLRELRASKVSWGRISMVLDGRPIPELKKRWIDIKSGRHIPSVDYRLDEDEEKDWYSDDESDEYDEEDERDFEREKRRTRERHVSFSSSTDEDTDDESDDESIPKRPKTKKIYYIDDEFTVDEVLLLHQISADWKKDRWETISRQFNEKTGRSISSTQAERVIEE